MTDGSKSTAAEIAQQIANMRRCPLLVWCQPFNEEIDWGCFERLRTVFPNEERIPRLDVLIHSSGGDIHCAYRCLRIIHRHAESVTALVPQWAKSAATFLTLGATEILLGRDGELGPLDAQLPDPAGSLQPQSALNEFQSLDQTRIFSLETMEVVAGMMMRAGMDRPLAYDRAQAVMAETSSHLYRQVRPQTLGMYGRYLQIAIEYADRVMRRWGGYSPRDSGPIARSLVRDYPAHEFVIDLHEARELRLRASAMEPDLDNLCWELVSREEPMLSLVNHVPPDVSLAAVESSS